jgi:hypothetical protein
VSFRDEELEFPYRLLWQFVRAVFFGGETRAGMAVMVMGRRKTRMKRRRTRMIMMITRVLTTHKRVTMCEGTRG